MFRVTDATGEVNAAWKYNGQPLRASGTTRIRVDAGSWGYLGLARPGPGYDAGDYEVTLTIDGSNETQILKFSVK